MIANYIRFVALMRDPDSHQKSGFFTAAYDLLRSDTLSIFYEVGIDHFLDWFRYNLDAPPEKLMEDNPKALCWFKDTANEHISKSRKLIQILQEHGIEIEMLVTRKPGNIIWEDEYQIMAIPYRDTKL